MTRRTPRLAPLAVALALGLAAPGAVAHADGPLPSDPLFRSLSVDGSEATGRLLTLGSDGGASLRSDDGKTVDLPAGRLIKLTREGPNPTLQPEASVVLFPGGDRLYRTALGAAGDTALDVQSLTLGNLAVPLESLLGLVFSAPAEPDTLDAAVRRVREERRASEVVWLANGDRLPVGFLGLTDKVLKYQTGKQPDSIDRSRVVALGFDPALASYALPKGPYLELTLSDGSRLGVTAAKLEQGHVVAASRFGAALKVPVAELAAVHARTPAVTYLTDRPAPREAYVPYVTPPRPWRRDATVEGQPFRLAGREYDRGLGTESRTLLAFKLEPGDRRFQAVVGLDDRAGPLGNVVFRVLVDGREAFKSPAMSAGDPPRAVDVDVAGGKALILVTEFGARGSVRDLADWVEARLVR